MVESELVIRGQHIVTPEHCGAAAIHIRDGRIVAVGAFEDVPRNCEVLEAGERVVLPGLVDSHVHVNEPGRTDWEGFETATRAAAAGGTTTIVDMPLNSIPPTTTREGFRQKLAAAEGKCAVDVAFWGGLVPDNVRELPVLFEAGVVGFKCFLIHSGVEEFPNVSEQDLRAALPELTRLQATLIVHAEVPGPVEKAAATANANGADAPAPQGEGASASHAHTSVAGGDPRRYETFLRSRPRAAENEAIELMIALSREFGARVHIVHHSSADALPAMRRARGEGLHITAETCPHYLCLDAESVPDGATEFKCCPPIRERENKEQLWEALGENLIEMVVSDHSPCPPVLKRRAEGDFMNAWGGISSLQLRLPLVWTEAHRRGYSFTDLACWLASAPARLTGLDGRKGAIAAGYDADLCIWNAEETFSVEPEIIEHRHKLTPYLGRTLRGVVEATYLRGRKIYERGNFTSSPSGVLLRRGGERVD